MNTIRLSGAAVAGLILLTSCTAPPARETVAPAKPAAARVEAGDALAAVEAADKAREEAMEAGDVDKYLEHYSDAAVWMPPDSAEIVGKEAARARLKQVLDGLTIDQASMNEEYVILGPDAIGSRGRYAMLAAPKGGGGTRQSAGSFVNLWRRGADGKWRIAWSAWNAVRDAAAPEAGK